MILGVFVSGNGSNLQAIIDAINSSELTNTEIGVVISNNSRAKALDKAKAANIPNYILYSTDMKYKALSLLNEHKVDFIVLAGFLKKLCNTILEAYPERIINIHPALLPKYGGKGMYGQRVHEAVLKGGEVKTGVTIHYVDGLYDHGKIIRQVKVPIIKNDTLETLIKRVLVVEHKLLVDVLKTFSEELED